MECPVSYECVIRAIVPQGSHDLFLGEVVGCHTNGKIVEDITEEEKRFITFEREDGSRYRLCWNTLAQFEEI